MQFGNRPLDLVIIGRSILSTYGNNTAALYRGLINELAQQGHRTTFLEPYDATTTGYRDLLRSPYCEVWTYRTTDQLLAEYTEVISSADVVMLGTGIPQTDRVAHWIASEARGITIYYDSDLARTRRSLAEGNNQPDCITCGSIANFSLFLSTTGGPALEDLARDYGLGFARPLYESVDPYSFYRTDTVKTYDLGFIGNYKAERTGRLDELLLGPARYTPNRQFALAGDHYPTDTVWPQNLTYLEHLPETNHVDFYNRQRATLVVSRQDRQELGYTPSRRLLAAAACGTPVLTDPWPGIEEFFDLRRELFPVNDKGAVLDVLYHTDEEHRQEVGAAARRRIMERHTTAHRARQLLGYWREMMD